MDESNKNNLMLSANGEKSLERFVNIDIYSSFNVKGIGGLYKYDFKDFIVKEITKERYTLEIKEDNLGSTFSNESKDRFTTFNLIKINRETFEAIKLISNALNVPVNSIYYSGLKDKCSISVQKVSIKGNFIEKLRKLKLKDIFIRNIYPSRKSVKLGSNWGNQFIITIRNIEKSRNTLIKIKKIFKILQNQGFPNYFGLQRFGTFRPNSHLIGRFILEGKFKEAFDEFVIKSYTSESIRSQKIRNELGKTGDLEKAYSDFPNSLNYEKIMIKYLIEHPGDYKGAIYQLPDYLKKLLLSSFQSYLFNRMITMRKMKGFPLFKPIKGDVISILDDVDGQCTQIIYKYGGNYDKYLKEALKLKRASIIFPLIGYDTNLDEFPLVKTLIKEIFWDEQINEEIFDSDLMKDHEFKGAFRAITVKPIGPKLLEFTEDDIFQEKIKLKLEFSLQKGSYATMLLRELIK
ncbi:MAG: tRNA pseudouridine(13) synthase TruD [Promethearchaeota archaeon]